MGAALGGGGGGGSRRRGRRGGGGGAPIGDINITPFVDVMLVLLIIFMVAAPLLTVGVPLDLPKTNADALPSEAKPPIAVEIDATGAVYLETEALELPELLERLAEAAGETDRAELRIRLRADQAAQYGDVARVMAALNRSGFRKIALVTDRATLQPAETPATGG